MWTLRFAARGQMLSLALMVLGSTTVGCQQNTGTTETPAAAEPATESDPVEPEVTGPSMVERVKAGVGVGKKGRSLDEFEGGIQGRIAQPAKAFFATAERMIFDVQIPQALQLFQATEGRLPRTHDEFMKRIIEPNQLRLPELPEGQEYEFDPERGELMVNRPG